MQLLERDDQLAQLASLFEGAARGDGTCVLVLGEAGIGKTALVRAFTRALPERDSVLWGGCEALFTPRPLGPIVDMAGALPPGLAARIHDGHTYNGLFPALLDHLSSRVRPSVMVIEDAHWADESTLDWIKYAGRRIAQAPVLLVLTVREDDVGIDHPLRRVMGELPTASTRRMRLAPFSAATIEALAVERGRDAVQLARLTSGNPFYLGEVLASEGDTLPASVRDAVLARIGRLSEAARRVVQWVAIEPGRLEHAIVLACARAGDDAVAETVARGILHADTAGLQFRHEIARRIVEAEVPFAARARMHGELLQQLRADPNASLPRLVHHAHAAGLTEDVARLAPRAAEEAARDGAHRDAAALYRLALTAIDRHEPAARAALLEAAATELQVTNAPADAIVLREQALELQRELGNTERVGANLRLLGVLHAQRGSDESHYLRYAQAAVDVLEPLGASGELAKAYASLSDVHYLLSDYDGAIALGERAVELADHIDDPAARVLALARLGAARLCRTDDAQARALVERALEQAIDARFEGLAAHTFVAVATLALNHHDYAYSLSIAERGLDYCQARDLDGYVTALRIRRGYALLQNGRWDESEALFGACLALPDLPRRLGDGARFALQRLAARRGSLVTDAVAASAQDDEVDAFWRDKEARLGTLQFGFRIPAIAAACAEAAWLRGDTAAAIDVARRGLDDAIRTHDARLGGPLQTWLQRLGAPAVDWQAAWIEPCAAELGGDIEGAAAAWARLGNPYEQALVLAFGDADQNRRALALLDALGAARAARLVRSRLRAAGVRGVTRGPHRRTRDDAKGLTPRERQVFELVALGLSNESIAQRLNRSERTVEHHVSAVLAKSGVKTRVELIALVTR